ncbi:FxsA family protein [Propionibacteriaceae bacterium G1746]|uniref:FxsA family protein n=1 Tax=Aestuariimicrobium sp. G57 TaxID=3418485 RepID=UPI003C13ECB0
MEQAGKFRWVGLVIALVVIAVPILEIWLLWRTVGAVGFFPTLFIVLGIAALGIALIGYQARTTLHSFVETTQKGQVPSRELSDGALVLVAGGLLLLPGFITDVLALLCLLPGGRELPRWVMNKVIGVRGASFGGPTVIPGEVVDEPSPDSSDDDTAPPALEGRVL